MMLWDVIPQGVTSYKTASSVS